MKRLLAGIFLLCLTAAAVYGYTATQRERLYRQALATGESALAQNDTSAAIQAFSGAITLKPDSMIGYLRRGQAYRRRNEFDTAIKDLRQAVKLDPSATRPLEELGDAYLADTPQRYSAAADRYAEYLRLDNRAPRVLYKLAFAKYNDGKAAEAVEALQLALAQDDHFVEAYYLLGLCERNLQHPDAARVALERSIKLQPALLHAREQLADLDQASGYAEDRLNQLRVLTALDPGPSREVALGLEYARSGQLELAVLTLGRATERYPEYGYASVALGRVWLEIAQTRDDRVALSKAIGALQGDVGSDENSEALTLFGHALLMTPDPEAAERILQEATSKSPLDPLAFAYLADAAERLGHYQVARRALLDYAAIRGDGIDPRHRALEAARLADLSMHLNQPAAAATYFMRAADASPTDASLLARAADAQFRAGDIETSRRTINSALAKDPTNPVALSVARRLIPARRPGA